MFYNESPDNNTPRGKLESNLGKEIGWDMFSKIGAIAGFAVFGVAYILTVVYIFVDINKRGKMYDAMIEEDLAKLQQMGL